MPDEATAVQFTRFVSSVSGRLVSRWDATGACFGARVATLEERKEGAETVQWDEVCVIPLTAPFCAKYDRELRNALRGGDLRERTREDWLAWLKLEEEREAKRVADIAAAAKSEPAVAAAPATEGATPPTTPPEPAEPKAKPEGRKKST